MGCLSERYRQSLQKEIPEIDALFGVGELKQILSELGVDFKKELLGERYISTPGHYSYLKIAEGCSRKCSFCAIPLIRGPHISRPSAEIIREAKSMVALGVKEINLISQDTTYYGLDRYHERRLPVLVNSLAQIQGLEWIRIHYAYPDGFPLRLLDVMSENRNVCKYIDIPLQHISSRILRSMKRSISGAKTEKLVETIRKKVPGIAIRTTFIVGYPGETKAEFRELLDFVKASRFERVGIFKYSHEEDTPAFLQKDNIPEKIKDQRAEELMQIQESISFSLNSAKIGQSLRVIIDKVNEENIIARSEFDSPEVDNEILISKKRHHVEPGEFRMVRVTGAENFDLYAELV